MTRAARTYWHLADLGAKPSRYEVATSRLLYHPKQGFEVNVPVEDWFRRHGAATHLRVEDWEAFSDPRETTYERYCEVQHASETLVDGLFQSIEDPSYPIALHWEATLAAVVPTLRFPVHALQMVAAYLGQLAPASRIVIACAMQAGDELRRIQRFAHRTALLEARAPGTAERSRSAWTGDPRWQPLRALLERLLVTYDWGEAFVALNLCVKPAFDEMFVLALARRSAAAGDGAFAEVLRALHADCRWHREWTLALVQTILDGDDTNGAVIRGWRHTWDEEVRPVMASCAKLFQESENKEEVENNDSVG
jgi:toluene monooxygenase system protein E